MAEEEAARDAEADALDEEISALKAQAASLRKALQVGASTILSSAPMQQILRDTQSNTATLRQTKAPAKDALATRASQQQAYMQQCLHRIACPVTAFKVHDPDPNAVDGGHVLCLRFEVLSRGQFLRPYYVMLNRPFPRSKHLRVHRHTIPPAIPLAGLAGRFLPAPPRKRDGASKQDLDRFARALRHEIARFHNRLGVSADLRRGLGLHKQRTDDVSPDSIVDMGIADTEAKQINLTWADERSGRLVMDDDGNVVNAAVFSTQGRDWETAKEILADGGHIEEVARRLKKSVDEQAE